MSFYKENILRYMQISLSLFYIDNCADILYSKGKYIMSFCNGSGRMKAGLPY